ncbi:hypothetical protein HGRIS_000570 [Hohenbuehelia grisea]|uniref:Uncharacterized protein n=1 Tax=Hohenbuehelia grisea TaxID=104357 RepID=A0ABR3JRD8_9AGAR
MSMDLRRVGGKSDGGIDLLGWWWLPAHVLAPEADAHFNSDASSVDFDASKVDVDASYDSGLQLDSGSKQNPHPQCSSSKQNVNTRRVRVRVLAQCKAEKQKAGPKYIREMEGVLHRYMIAGSPHSNSHSRSDTGVVIPSDDFYDWPSGTETSGQNTVEPTVTTNAESNPHGTADATSLMNNPMPSALAMFGSAPAQVPHSPMSHYPIPSSANPSSPIVALFISESPFTKSAILRALSSPVPFFLLHLPPIHTNTNTKINTNTNTKTDTSSAAHHYNHPNAAEDTQPDDALGAALWNPALGGARGLLRGKLEARWERRPALWCDGVRVESWTPGLGSKLNEQPHES